MTKYLHLSSLLFVYVYRNNFNALASDLAEKKYPYPLGEGHPILEKLPQERTIYTFCKSVIIKFQVYYHANASISPFTPPNPLL